MISKRAAKVTTALTILKEMTSSNHSSQALHLLRSSRRRYHSLVLQVSSLSEAPCLTAHCSPYRTLIV